MIYHGILRATVFKGQTPKFCHEDYGSIDSLRSGTEYFHGGVSGLTAANVLDTINNHEIGWALRIWPRADISDGVSDIPLFAAATAQTGAAQGLGLYPFGYFTQWYPIAVDSTGHPIAPATYLPGSPTDPDANQNNNEYWLVQNAAGALYLTQAIASFGTGDNRPGVTIDSPGLWLSFKQALDQIKAALGGSFSNAFASVSDVPLADHPLNYGGTTVPVLDTSAISTGEPGNSGGHNRNSYRRFVGSAFYSSQVSVSGTHTKDNTACAVFYLKGAAGLIGTAQVPTVQEAQDIDAYHKLGNANLGVTDGFGGYLATAQASLELQVKNYVDPSGVQTYLRTSIPQAFWENVSGFKDAPKASVLSLGEAGALFQSTGGDMGTPYWNQMNPGDDYSSAIGTAVGGIPFDNCASAQAVANYYLNILPNWSHHPRMEMDTLGGPSSKWPAYTTQPPTVVRAAAVPMIPHFGGLLSSMDSPAGWTGYEADSIRVLISTHYFSDLPTFSPFGLVAHAWGTDSYSGFAAMNLYDRAKLKRTLQLADFQVLYWDPNPGQTPSFAVDVAIVTAYVQDGGTLVMPVDLQNGWDSRLNVLLGESWSSGGTGASGITAQNPTHPIWNPYSSTDVTAAYASLRGNASSKRTRTDIATSITPLLTDATAGDAAWIHTLGLGRVVVWPIHRYGDGFNYAGNGADGLASGLAYLVLNSVVWGGGGTPPGPYLPKFVDRTGWAQPLNANGQGVASGVTVVAVGLKGLGNEKLFWISNSNPTAEVVSIAFSSSFYGTPSPWTLVDANGGAILTGTGDVSLSALQAQPLDWRPLYLQGGQTHISTTTKVSAKAH